MEEGGAPRKATQRKRRKDRYRSLCIFDTCDKLLERLIADRLIDELSMNRGLSERQLVRAKNERDLMDGANLALQKISDWMQQKKLTIAPDSNER